MATTYNNLYLDLRTELRRAGDEEATQSARELVCAAAAKTREELVRDGSLYASPEVEQSARELVKRHLAGEPVAYLIGEWEFYGLPLDISPAVLIPRPDTEVLATKLIDAARGAGSCRILDLCAGSGCIGLAAAANLPNARVLLGEYDEEALKICRQNIRRNRLTARVASLKIDAREKPARTLGEFQFLVSNPPYIPSADIDTLDASVREHEPRLALDGGADGLDFYRVICEKWRDALCENGMLFFEVGIGQADQVLRIMRSHGFGDNTVSNVEAISTGSLALDLALGIGGLPKGRIIEIYGPESSGKTTLALHVLAQAQKAGGEVAFIDAEHALDITYARALGVKVEDMLVSQPDTGEQALEITEALVRSGAIDVIVVDSVAALVPRAEIEGEMGDSFVGLHARLMSQALRKLTGAVGKTNTIVIFINQLREKVGVMYGNPEVTTGGRALKFYSSVRIDVRRIEALKNGSEIIGNRTRAKVVKNKMAPPFREAEFDIMYGEGISMLGELIDLGVKLGLVQKSGSWYSMGETRIGQGRDAAKQYLKNNPEIADNLEAEIRRNFDKLMTGQSRVAAKAAGRAVDVSADDFKDED